MERSSASYFNTAIAVELKRSSAVLPQMSRACIRLCVGWIAEHIGLLPGRAVHVPQFQHRLLLLKRVIVIDEVNTQISALIGYLVPCCAVCI